MSQNFVRRCVANIVVAVSMLWISPGIARAQQPPETLPFNLINQAYDTHGIDNINLFNGDVGISLPLGPAYALGPTGYQYQFALSNSVKFWHFSAATCGFNTGQFAWIAGDPTAGVGWTFQPGYVVKRIPPGVAAFWEYYDPSGSPHKVDLSTANPAVTTDGSHLRIKALPNATSPTSFTVEFRDGTIHTFDHQYSPPAASPASVDFRNVDYGETAQTRFGLHTIQDRFGNTLVTVIWGANASEVSSIGLTPLTGSVSLTWKSFSVGGFSWRVLDYVQLSAPGSKTLKVLFGYQPGTFNRNDFDTGTSGCTVSPATVNVPELASISFSDPGPTPSILPFSYAFTYYGNPVGLAQYQGAVHQLTLPATGTISYVYDVTATHPCVIGPTCNPNNILTVEPENPQPPPTAYWDDSPAVVQRTEHDPYANQDGITNYVREQFEGGDENRNPIPTQIFRRVTVTPPSGFARRHYFKVDDPGGGVNQRDASGVELDRRYFADSNANATPIRSMIMCYLGLCGYQDSNGIINDFNFTPPTGRRPPTDIVTWFGAHPNSGSIPPADGGTCSSSWTPACTVVKNGTFNPDAGRYKTTELTGTLPGGVDRTVEVNWTPSMAAGHWILDLFDHRYTWDGGGASPPAGSNGSTVVRENFTFDSVGFLTSARTWDSVAGKAIRRCFYRNTNGTPLNDYSTTFTAASEPTSDSCGSIPSTGTDDDTFGQSHTSTNMLLTQTNWRKGTTSIGWNSFDVLRDSATGYILEARDPNYPSNSNLKTTYTYDALGRIIMIQPPGTSSVEWPTTFCYVPQVSGSTGLLVVKKTTASPTLDPASASGICKADDGVPGSGSGPILGQQVDGFGRVVRNLRRNNKALTGGSYFETQDTRFDSAGHVSFSSDWQSCGTSLGATNVKSCAVNQGATAGPGTLYANFDPFGRVGAFADLNGGNFASEVFIDRTDARVSPSITYSDSYEKTQTMCVNGTWSGGSCSGAIGGASGVFQATEYDALGRITKVTEPDATTGLLSSDTTTYTYGVLDGATQVVQGSQTRNFAYSAFGFLTSAQTPENGQTGNASTSFSLYGSLGNLRTKTDPNPGGTQYNYSYDAAVRLALLTTGTASPFTEFVVNCYDGTGTCGDTTISNFAGGSFPKGRLTRRVGFNQISFQAAPVYDDFSYGDTAGTLCPATDLSGRLCARTTSIGARGTDLTKNGFGLPVTQKWTFNTLGAITTHVHPRPSGSASTLTVNDSAYTSGFLTNITATKQGGTTQQIVTANYHESGRLADYTTGSTTPNVKTTTAADSIIPSRPASFTAVTSPGSTTLFQTGFYNYDGLNSIKAIGSDSFTYDGRSRLTQAFYSGTGGGTQGFTYERYGNLTSKTGVNPVTLTTTVGTNHLASGIGTYDERGNLASFASGGETLSHDLLNRLYRSADSVALSDFTYLYDGGGERVAKFPSKGGATRREFARVMIEARGDSPLACSEYFADVPCASNPNDGKYISKMKEIGITAGCGGGNFCPEVQTRRDQSAAFFLKAEHCQLNVNNCTYAPPTCSSTVFTDVPCPGGQFVDWVNQLAAEQITTGCGGGNFCPADSLGSWQMLAWAQKIWPTYNPLPRASVLTYRDEGARVVTEANQSGSNDASAVVATARDNVFLGSQLVSSGVWSPPTWTTLNYHFYASDHLGTPRLVTDVSATLQETRKYWPYGDDGPTTGSDTGQRLRLAGMERDTETKHYYDHARTEGFGIGRFLSKDPIGGDPEYPQSWNRYSYVRGSPISLIDPRGLFWIPTVICAYIGCYSTSVDVVADPIPWDDSNPGSIPSPSGPIGPRGGGGIELIPTYLTPPITKHQSYGGCVAERAESASIRETFNLGNSFLSKALFANAPAVAINLVRTFASDEGAPRAGDTAKDVAGEVLSEGAPRFAVAAAHTIPNVTVTLVSTEIEAGVTSGGSAFLNFTTTVAETSLPIGTGAAAAAGFVSGIGEMKLGIDIITAAAAAGSCARSRF